MVAHTVYVVVRVQFPGYRDESERCKLIMHMKSFLDTDHTTGSL